MDRAQIPISLIHDSLLGRVYLFIRFRPQMLTLADREIPNTALSLNQGHLQDDGEGFAVGLLCSLFLGLGIWYRWITRSTANRTRFTTTSIRFTSRRAMGCRSSDVRGWKGQPCAA